MTTHPPETVVRVTQRRDQFDATPGQLYRVEEYVPPEQDDETPPTGFYLLLTMDRMGPDVAHPDDIEVVRTAAEQAVLDEVPSLDQLTALIADGLIRAGEDDLEVNETQQLRDPRRDDAGPFEAENEFTHGVEFYGRRRDGATFGAIVRVTGYWRTDP